MSLIWVTSFPIECIPHPPPFPLFWKEILQLNNSYEHPKEVLLSRQALHRQQREHPHSQKRISGSQTGSLRKQSVAPQPYFSLLCLPLRWEEKRVLSSKRENENHSQFRHCPQDSPPQTRVHPCNYESVVGMGESPLVGWQQPPSTCCTRQGSCPRSPPEMQMDSIILRLPAVTPWGLFHPLRWACKGSKGKLSIPCAFHHRLSEECWRASSIQYAETRNCPFLYLSGHRLCWWALNQNGNHLLRQHLFTCPLFLESLLRAISWITVKARMIPISLGMTLRAGEGQTWPRCLLDLAGLRWKPQLPVPKSDAVTQPHCLYWCSFRLLLSVLNGCQPLLQLISDYFAFAPSGRSLNSPDLSVCQSSCLWS